MPTVGPWNSKKEAVCHNNTACKTGNNIERENRQEGGAGKPLCKECQQLNAAGK